MKKYLAILPLLGVMSLACHLPVCVAADASGNPDTPVEKKADTEEKIPPNYFAIAFYKPTYLLPFYYTGSPDNSVYQNNTPDDEQLDHSEVKYQFSFKVPVWKNILNHSSSLYLAYTQMSYWQAYNKEAFFRETDYEPELFLANEINFNLYKAWEINFLNFGMDHQSNGYGDTLERSWNRVYLEAISSSANNWILSIKPWYIIHDSTMEDHNSDIGKYLGYGQILVGYEYHKQVFSVTAQNVIESGCKRPTAILTWSFPLTPYIKGYVQALSGYGQSLIEYNHHTNSAGVGIALSDWV